MDYKDRQVQVWAPTSVDQTPVIELARWSVIRFSDGIIRLVGYNLTEREGRVSSRVVEYDKKARTFTTRSGRRYILVGEPGHSRDGWYVMTSCYANAEYTEITEEFI